MDFPGGTMEKNLPAKAGDMGSIPGLEDSTSQLLSLHVPFIGKFLQFIHLFSQ